MSSAKKAGPLGVSEREFTFMPTRLHRKLDVFYCRGKDLSIKPVDGFPIREINPEQDAAPTLGTSLYASPQAPLKTLDGHLPVGV
jgi:hypothetical protein